MTDRICCLCGTVNDDSSDDFENVMVHRSIDNTGSGTWPLPHDI